MRGGVVAAFGGGGVKSVAHVGAMRALDEAGIAVGGFVGTSMGAVVAALFAAGLDVAEALARVHGARARPVATAERLLRLRGLALPSLLRDDGLRRLLAEWVPARRFDELAKPLAVTAADLDSGEPVLFGAGGRDAPLHDALLASCALPVYYPPVVIGGRRYGDGGLHGALPLEPAARAGASLVVAVDTGPGFDEAPPAAPPQVPPIIRAHDEATGILMAAVTQAQLALWRALPDRPPLVYVRPRSQRGDTFRQDLAEQYLEEGYRATREALTRHREQANSPGR